MTFLYSVKCRSFESIKEMWMKEAVKKKPRLQSTQHKRENREGKGKRSDPIIYDWAASVCSPCYANISHTHSYQEDILQLWKTGRMPPVETAVLSSELHQQMLFQLVFLDIHSFPEVTSKRQKKNQRIWRFHHPFLMWHFKTCIKKNRVMKSQLIRDGV